MSTFNRAISHLSKVAFKIKHLHKGKSLFSRRFLLYTNTSFGIITAVTGDLIQQNYQRLMNDENRRWDPKRSGKMATAGLIFGPCIHFWYIFLEKVLPGRSVNALIIKICLDQFLFSPFCISIFLTVVGLLERQGLDLLKEEFRETGVLMFLTDMVIWTPAQAINFYFVPTKYRVLYDNSVSLVVDVFYSYLRFEHKTTHGERESQSHRHKVKGFKVQSSLS
ncbi:mpv17-like protein 2 [Biomphalaria pfeifferi]|uniref:Mpv17-like protein 2 n=1 Tax=Biomphalaria pfeifferi TaxID=112525 RepID=A0AAD8BVU0_BIOPF|nr:mpv17-like protein 2 [Biomphalaria pfeifferi]